MVANNVEEEVATATKGDMMHTFVQIAVAEGKAS